MGNYGGQWVEFGIQTGKCGKDNPKITRYCAFGLFLELCVGKFKKAKKNAADGCGKNESDGSSFFVPVFEDLKMNREKEAEKPKGLFFNKSEIRIGSKMNMPDSL